MELLDEIWNSLGRNKLRTALTGFAVSWGLLMIIALLGAGNGLMNALTSNMGVSLTNIMTVHPGRRSLPYDGMKAQSQVRMDVGDVDFTANNFRDVIDDVTARIIYGSSISYGKESLNATINGVAPLEFSINNRILIAGRFLNELDMKEKRRTMVLFDKTASSLLGDDPYYEKILGKYVNIANQAFLIVGIIKADEFSGGTSEVYIPLTTLTAIRQGGTWFSNISFSFHSLETEPDNEEFENHYKTAMNRRHRAAPTDKSTFYIYNSLTNSLQMNKAVKIMNIAMWILGFFTLLSGIVGVSNIMLITVKERIREIGVRKALGASPWQITKLIVAESIVITAIFGFIGMLLGLGTIYLMDITLANNPTDLGFVKMYMFKDPGVDISIALEAMLLIVVAGTVAGLLPALKAAKVRPIEALRND